MFTGHAALYGIENTNRGCGFNRTFDPGQSVPASTLIDGTKPGLGILTGKANLNDSDPNTVNPGGVPVYKGGRFEPTGYSCKASGFPTSSSRAIRRSDRFYFWLANSPPNLIVESTV